MSLKFKLFICGLAGLCWCQTNRAQDDSFRPELSYGVNGGITLSKVSFNPSVPQDYLQQYTGGITVRYISEKNFGLQGELNYSLRGWKERVDTVSHLSSYSRSIAYLELPLMTHIYFNMSKRTRVLFNMGPQVGYYLNEKTVEKDLIVTYPNQIPPYYDTEVQRIFDWGITGGMGFEFRTGIGSFIVDGRYYFGLSDIFSNSKSDYFQSSSNQVISIKLAYLFRK